MCFNVALLLKAKDCDRVFVSNDPVNFFDPWGLISAGQLGIGNPGSYGSENTCESMYDEHDWKQDVEFLAKAVATVTGEVAIITGKKVFWTTVKTLTLHKIGKVAKLTSVEGRALSRPLKSVQILNKVDGTDLRDTGRRINGKIEAIRDRVFWY